MAVAGGGGHKHSRERLVHRMAWLQGRAARKPVLVCVQDGGHDCVREQADFGEGQPPVIREDRCAGDCVRRGGGRVARASAGVQFMGSVGSDCDSVWCDTVFARRCGRGFCGEEKESSALIIELAI